MISSRGGSRRSGAILAALVFTLAAVPGLATATDSRDLWIGSPNAQTNAGKLFATPVSVPAAAPAPVNSTIFVVQILSTDNQNLAHTILTIDWNNGVNAGLSLNDYYDPDGGDDASDTFCDTAGSLITCDYGSLAALGQRTVAVVVDVAPTYVVAGQGVPLFWAKVETNNETGPNTQLFTADSGGSVANPNNPFRVGPLSANGLNTFVPPGQAKQLFTAALGTDGAGNVSTTINFVAHGVGDTFAIFEGTSNETTYPCPSGLACQPFYSEAIAQNSSFGSTPFFTWTLNALVPKPYTLAQGFVAHFSSPTVNDWTLYFKNKTAYCGTDIAAKIATALHCIVFATLSKPVNGFSTLSVQVVMDAQGGMKL